MPRDGNPDATHRRIHAVHLQARDSFASRTVADDYAVGAELQENIPRAQGVRPVDDCVRRFEIA